MGVISHGIALGIGYHLAQPSGQRQLAQLRHRVVELAQSPQATQLRERGRNSPGGRVLAAWMAIANRAAGNDLPKTDLATTDLITNASAADSRPVVEASAPARGRRLRRQRIRENRQRRPYPASPAGPETQAQPSAGSAAATSSPPLTPRAIRPADLVRSSRRRTRAATTPDRRVRADSAPRVDADPRADADPRPMLLPPQPEGRNAVV
jgi:hypothetical protein